jgi:hypothetical protein
MHSDGLDELGTHMSLTLAEALGQVDLQDGQVYRCQVNGHSIELRVLKPREHPESSGIDESDVMLDSWVELPLPPPISCVEGTYGPLPLPDPPEIPRDEGEP